MAEAPTLIAGVDSDTDVLEELARLKSVYPAWHTWLGVGRTLVYARRPLTSPPVVFRAKDTAFLWEQVREWENGGRTQAPPGPTEGITQ